MKRGEMKRNKFENEKNKISKQKSQKRKYQIIKNIMTSSDAHMGAVGPLLGSPHRCAA